MAGALHLVGLHLVPGHHHHLAGLDVPVEGGADGVQGAAFGGKHHVVPDVPHAQWAEAVGIPGGNELGGAHDHQGVRTLEQLHGGQHRLLDGGALQPLLGDDVSDDLGIGGGVENRALLLQFIPQVEGVG